MKDLTDRGLGEFKDRKSSLTKYLVHRPLFEDRSIKDDDVPMIVHR